MFASMNSCFFLAIKQVDRVDVAVAFSLNVGSLSLVHLRRRSARSDIM